MLRFEKTSAIGLSLTCLLGCSRTGLDFEASGALTTQDGSTSTPALHPDASQSFRACPFTGPTEIAPAQGGGTQIDALALDDQFVYWTNFDDGHVYEALKTGGGAIVDLATSGANPEGLAVSGGYVYWADFNANTISRVPVIGGDVEVLATAQDGADDVVVDGDYVYWTSYRSAGAVGRCPLAGGTAEIIAQGSGPYVEIASDGPHVFWSSQIGTITSFTVASEASATVEHPVTGGTIWSLVTDGTNLYWSEVFTANRISIVGAPIAGGSAIVLASVTYDPGSCPGPAGGGCESGLATDGENVYFAVDGAGSPGSVGAVPVAGGTVQSIETSAAGLGIGVDDACVYWSTAEGAIMGAPR